MRSDANRRKEIMGYYKLIRNPAEGKAVRGKIYWTSHYYNKRLDKKVERLHYICETLENAEVMIPALVYRVNVTMSPKFGRLLPILQQVPGRSGIRVHCGSRPKHSKGCILVSKENENKLTELWLKEQKDHEETRLEICAG